MKRFSLIAALALGGLLAFSTIAMAQDATKDTKKNGKRGFPTVEQQLEKMTKDLSLTDEQKPKVKAVLEDVSKKRQELRGTPQDEQRAKRQAIMEEQNKKMKEILTPDQLEKYKKMQEEMKKNYGGKKKKTE
jgi:periplasmic protein CpxP/Spy